MLKLIDIKGAILTSAIIINQGNCMEYTDFLGEWKIDAKKTVNDMLDARNKENGLTLNEEKINIAINSIKSLHLKIIISKDQITEISESGLIKINKIKTQTKNGDKVILNVIHYSDPDEPWKNDQLNIEILQINDGIRVTKFYKELNKMINYYYNR